MTPGESFLFSITPFFIKLDHGIKLLGDMVGGRKSSQFLRVWSSCDDP